MKITFERIITTVGLFIAIATLIYRLGVMSQKINSLSEQVTELHKMVPNSLTQIDRDIRGIEKKLAEVGVKIDYIERRER